MKLTKNLEFDHDQADSLTGAIPLTRSSTAQLLSELLNVVKQNVVAFDLDSTLLDNRPRNAFIMREFGVQQNEPLLGSALAEHFKDWSAGNAMMAMGLPDGSIERLTGLYQPFWFERFFSSEYCRHDISIPGAAEFVSAVVDHGGTVCYLTGRHEGMRAGTQSSLQKLGFPVPGSKGVTLMMKPDKTQSDDLFKVDTLQQLESLGVVCAAFDNEPTHINSYRKAFPNALCVHLQTDHSMREVTLLSGIVSIPNFVK